MSAARAEGLDPDAPDFGIRFARRFAAACREGRFPRRRKRGLLRQHREGLKWIRHAIRYLERQGEGLADGGGILSPPQRAVRGAIALDHDPPHAVCSAPVDRPRRGGRESGAGAAARCRGGGGLSGACSSTCGTVINIHSASLPRWGTRPARSGRAVAGRNLPPLWEFASMSFPAALLRCGLAGRQEVAEILVETGEAGEAWRFESAARFVLMTPERINPASKEVAKALPKYEAMEAELRKQKPVSLMTESFIKAIKPVREPETPEPLSGQNDDVSDAADGTLPEPLQPGEVGIVETAGSRGGRDQAETPGEFKEAFQIIASRLCSVLAASCNMTGFGFG